MRCFSLSGSYAFEAIRGWLFQKGKIIDEYIFLYYNVQQGKSRQECPMLQTRGEILFNSLNMWGHILGLYVHDRYDTSIFI